MRITIQAAIFSLALLCTFGCEDTAGCDDCGGTLDEGFLFKYVEAADILELSEIEGIDIEIGACIRYKLEGEDFDPDNVAVVDDCCCETLGY